MLTALYMFMSEPQKFITIYRDGEIYIMPVRARNRARRFRWGIRAPSRSSVKVPD